MKILKEKKGITLIAVIVTIIILLILALVTANAAISGNIFNNTKKAASRHEMEEDIELINVTVGEYLMTKKMDSEEIRTLAEYINDKDWCESAIEDEEDNIIITMAGTGTQYMIDSEGKVKLVHEHDWKETGRLEATCGANGYIDYRCTICRETKREIIPATGEHDFVDNVCTICGYELGWLVPEGGTYEAHGNGSACDENKDPETFYGGQKVPYALSGGDIFWIGDYTYKYTALDGFTISINTDVTDKNQTSYDDLYAGDINGGYIQSVKNLFKNCKNLTSAPAIPDTVTDMTYSFFGCTSLTDIPAFPKSLTNLEYAFSGCTSLQSVPEIPNGVTKMKETFRGCTSLTTAPNIPSGVADLFSIFSNCTSLVTYAGSTDANGDFSNYIIPSSVTSIRNMFGGGVSTGTTKQGCPIVIPPYIPSSVTNMSEAFLNCRNLTTVHKIPSSVTIISSAFSGCTSLVNPPDFSEATGISNLTETFMGCTSLRNVTSLPQNVTSLKNTFKGCTSLQTVPAIPSSVTSMDRTFSGCTSMTTTPTILGNVTMMEGTFFGCTALTSVQTLPNTVENMSTIFSECRSLILPPTLPSSVTDLSSAFNGCTSLTTAPTIPSGVQNMSKTFNSCTSLRTYAGSNAPNGDFSGYVIPNSVTNLSGTFGGGTTSRKQRWMSNSYTSIITKWGIEYF